MKTQMKQYANLLSIALAIMLGCFGTAIGDEYYAGGETVEIDFQVFGYVWVEDATVNLYDGAHIVDDTFYGDIYATSGAVISIYGGTVDGIFFVDNGSPDFEPALVTIYGTDFAVDGVPVDPAVSEVYLENQYISGVYASGAEFSHLVDCSPSGVTIKLAWLVPDPTPAEQMELIMAYYELAVEEGAIEAVQRGKGRNSRRWNRFRSKHDPFEKMLCVAQRLIDMEYDAYAAEVLTMISKKCDGEKRPRDIITGEGVIILSDMINELIVSLTETQE
ncbi:MAG: hypothetical protein ACYTER_08315 [Planctomycetota bacterium]|jgi:hypothetical protein